jgi:hypothetical protein
MILNNATNAAVAQEATKKALKIPCPEKKSAAQRLPYRVKYARSAALL